MIRAKEETMDRTRATDTEESIWARGAEALRLAEIERARRRAEAERLCAEAAAAANLDGAPVDGGGG